ncbi:hypothetical protein G4B88_003640, partial [Cannabis sativa]
YKSDETLKYYWCFHKQIIKLFKPYHHYLPHGIPTNSTLFPSRSLFSFYAYFGEHTLEADQLLLRVLFVGTDQLSRGQTSNN